MLCSLRGNHSLFFPLWGIDYSLIQQNKGLINLHGSMKNKLAQFKMGLIQYYKLEDWFQYTLSPFTSPNLTSREWYWKRECSLHGVLCFVSFFRIQSLEIFISFPKPHFISKHRNSIIFKTCFRYITYLEQPFST